MILALLCISSIKEFQFVVVLSTLLYQDLLSIANVAEQHEVWDFLSASSKVCMEDEFITNNDVCSKSD